MKDMEDLLKNAPLSEPPGPLDQRVEAAVREAEHRYARRRPAGVPLWAFAAGCLACTLIGFLIHPLVEQAPPAPAEGAGVVMYIVEPASSSLRILGTRQDENSRSFWQKKRGEVRPLVRN